MTINKSLKDITFYGKAKDFVPYFFDDQLETIEYYLDEYPLEEGWTESSLNEFFSEEKNQDTIAQLLGYENRIELLNKLLNRVVDEGDE